MKKLNNNGHSKPREDYEVFIAKKSQMGGNHGFDPLWMPDFLFDFQKHLALWNQRKGKCADFADCGMGKTPLQLVWAENIVRKTGGKVLILTPLAVSYQTVSEGEKFGIEVNRSNDGTAHAGITVTNYERLHYFNSSDFTAVVCDESSILKNFDGVTKAAVTEFMRMIPYRLLCTATAAPNDYIELGTSSEALGELGYMDMLGQFFKGNNGSLHPTHNARSIKGDKFRFRGHAERNFWRWVCSWARAVRKPSDLGFEDGAFNLPPLITREHVVSARVKSAEFLFDLPAVSLAEQRDERRRTLTERCEMVAALVNETGKPAVSWCHLNDEGDLLEELIPDAVQVSGSDSDEQKEEAFVAFAKGEIRVLVSKPVIAGLGLNWQHCAHQTFFPSHSFEQYYQGVRRSWRFGQKNSVTVDVVTSEGEANVLKNLQRKAAAAEEMFSKLVSLMGNELKITKQTKQETKQKLPSWITSK